MQLHKAKITDPIPQQVSASPLPFAAEAANLAAAPSAPRRRVLIDGYFFGRPYGFGRFLSELSHALGEAESDIQFIVVVPSNVDHDLLKHYSRLTWHVAKYSNRIFWEQIRIPRVARTLKCDLIHFPCNTTAWWTYGIPSITTVHDLIFLSEKPAIWQPRAFLIGKYIKLSFKHFAKRSRALISVSKTTQALLTERGMNSQVVYNTAAYFISKNQPVQPLDSSSQRRPYFLHRGGTAVHRNTKRVLEAFRIARNQLPDVALKILGLPEEIAATWTTPEDDNIEFLPRLSDSDLARLYSDSSCVIVASLQEGFGLPIIEAFGFGAPVITSNLDPMREVAGDAACFVDPLDTTGMAEAIISIMSKPDFAGALIARGRRRLDSFASDTIASQMLAVYSTVC